MTNRVGRWQKKKQLKKHIFSENMKKKKKDPEFWRMNERDVLKYHNNVPSFFVVYMDKFLNYNNITHK